MTAKEYLNQAYWLDRRIDSRLEQLKTLNELATRTTGVMNDCLVSHTRNPHSMEDVIVRIIFIEKEIHEDVEQMIAKKQEIMDRIQEVSS